jgi:hypothetical protein
MDQDKRMQAIRRAQLYADLHQSDVQTLDERVGRLIEIDRQDIIGGHHFAAASSECICLYRDGHFIATVMTTQAVNEGILKFVAERNNIQEKEHAKLMAALLSAHVVTQECAEAAETIWGSYRNDVHHMNPAVGTIQFRPLAKKNLQALAVIDREVFGGHFGTDGAFVPDQPKYWDIRDGKANVFLRLDM